MKKTLLTLIVTAFFWNGELYSSPLKKVVKDSSKNQRTWYLGFDLNAKQSSIRYFNSDYDKIKYSSNIKSGFGLNGAMMKNHWLFEARVSYARTEAYLIQNDFNSMLEMEFIQPSVNVAYLFLPGKLKIKAGVGLGSGHFLSGIQTNNGQMIGMKRNWLYRSNEFAFSEELGLTFNLKGNINYHLTYSFRQGVTNIEKTVYQKTTTFSHGINSSFQFLF